jgi:hypothetical protein
MSFDNSRFTFSPWNDYFGVVMQQGRVQLDSDWNELLAELTRRIQAGTMDILGLSGVPSTTPYAFAINAFLDASALPHITIGAGRIYVDGLLAENHGASGSAQWDPALAEWSGTPQIPGAAELVVDFTQQPYLPGATLPPAGAVPPGKGPFIAYLDVWQRAVTYLGDPNLVEKAVGVDTTGRLQTVWQVKLLDVSSIGGVVCSTPDSAIAPWQDLIQPSASLLTTGLVPSTSSGPCALGPTTGYTGLENQFYRVEIHQPGVALQPPQSGGAAPPPPATFKWSRDNASVSTAVTAISAVTNSANKTASQLMVQSMGRDQVLGFNPGDWIEITDDFQELNGQAGELHQIDSINPAAKAITLDSAVSATSFPVDSTGQTNASRHTRIQRWDQAGTVYQSDGVTVWVDLDSAGSAGIPVPPSGAAVVLENGITVAFSLTQPGGSLGAQYTPTFETGDYWNFAARTADGSVEALVAAPPLGIHHHYCRLGVVNFNATPPQVGDCRQVFPALANPALHVTGVFLGSGAQLQNDGTYSIKQLSNGINIVCDAPVDPAIITQPTTQTQLAAAWNATTAYTPGQAVTSGGNYYICLAANTNQTPPSAAFWAIAQFNSRICFVTVELPVPATPPAGGYNPLILSSTVSVGPSTTINWTPTLAAQTALANQVLPTAPPVLAHLTLKGNCIWAQGNPNVYLNGATTGVLTGAAGSQRTTGLQLPSGDGRGSADFDMWFWLVSQPPITLSPSVPNVFPAQLVGTSSAPQSITLTFSGTIPAAPLTITSIAGSPEFTQTNTYTAPLAAGASCTINITFTPAGTGVRTGQITITESASSSPIVILLTGTGIAPQIASSTSGLTFIQTVATTSAPQTVTLTNTGSAPLTISGISISIITAGATDYSQTSNCLPGGSGTWQPRQSCAISVQFTPAAAGSRLALLIISHNAAGSPLAIPLTGTGTTPVKVIEVKSTIEVKARDLVKSTDTVKTGDIVKAVETVRAELGTPANVPATGAAGEAATKSAFISPQERPPVGPQTAPPTDDEPPKEGPKQE